MAHYIGMGVPISPDFAKPCWPALYSTDRTNTDQPVSSQGRYPMSVPPQVYIRLFTSNAAQMPVSMYSLSHQVPLSDRVGGLPFANLVYALCTILEGVV